MLKRSVTYQKQRYDVLLIAEDDGGYSATAPAVPGAYSDGDNEAEVLENIADAIAMLKESADEVTELLRKRGFAAELEPKGPTQSSNTEAAD